jgi:hypothetical protein
MPKARLIHGIIVILLAALPEAEERQVLRCRAFLLMLITTFGTSMPNTVTALLEHGTLVIAIPTCEGLLIAADSRVTIGEAMCDHSFKITEVQGVDRVGVVATGFTTVQDTTSLAGFPMAGICDHLYKIKPKFDALDIVKTKIEEDLRLASENFDQLPGKCLKSVADYMASDPGVFDPVRGRKLFQVAVGSYDPSQQTSYLRQFSVHIAADGSPWIEGVEVLKFSPADAQSLQVLGESSFMNTNVLYGPGSQFLTERYGRFRERAGDPIGATDVNSAADFAADLIEATARMTQFVPAPTGIGGPVDILLIGKEPRPKRLKWKIIPGSL